METIAKLCQQELLTIFNRKLHSSMYGSGLPDEVIIVDGRVYWCEFKRPGGKLTGQQRGVLSSIKKAGGNAYAIVGISRNVMHVLEPPKWNVKYKLTKSNGSWDGLRDMLGLPPKMEIDI